MNSAEPQVIVYRATNAVNGKTYIGFTTKGLRQRVNDHRWAANGGGGWLLHAAMRKYGHENITFETVFDFEGDEDLAKLYEIEAIAKYRPAYNISRGGDGGSVHPDTARKISEANKGRPSFLKGKKFSPEALEKFRATKARNGKPHPCLGRKDSPEEREAKRLRSLGKPSPMKGKTYGAEVRQRMRIAAQNRKARVYTDEDRERAAANVRLAHVATRKPVRCLDDGRVFGSAAEATKFYGYPERTVSKIITQPRSKGSMYLRFEYVNKDTE